MIKEVRNAGGRFGNISAVEAEIRRLDKELALPLKLSTEENEDADFWLQLPRTFSYQSSRYWILEVLLNPFLSTCFQRHLFFSRFELPLDMSMLEDMTPVDYLERHVSVSSFRRQLYNKVYCRNRSLKDGMLNDEVIR